MFSPTCHLKKTRMVIDYSYTCKLFIKGLSMNCPYCNGFIHHDETKCPACGRFVSANNNISFLQTIYLKYFCFDGRMSRYEYWRFIVFFAIVYFLSGWTVIVPLIFLIPTITAITRRLHDLGKSGWYCLILLPLFGLFCLLLYLLFSSLAPDDKDTFFNIVFSSIISIYACFFVLLATMLILCFPKGKNIPNKYGEPPNQL